MSEVTANIVVQPISATIVLDNNPITITPTATQLNIYNAGAPNVAGSNTQVQYNDAGAFGASSGLRFDKNSNTLYVASTLNAPEVYTSTIDVTYQAHLGPVSNVTITGGTSGYFLKTDGTGNLSFASVITAPGGSNTQLQYNNNGVFGGIANATYSAGNLHLKTANVKMTGGTNGQVLQTDGTGNMSWTAMSGGGGNGSPGGANTQVQFNDAGLFGGVVGFTFDNVSNVLTVPNLTLSSNNIKLGNGAAASANSIAIGRDAVTNDDESVAIGHQAYVGANSIAIGAGNLIALPGANSVTVGHQAGSGSSSRFSANVVSVGYNAGYTGQKTGAVALGFAAGRSTQGNSAVAIGANAGYTSQANNSIIINATGANLDQTTANTFTVKPVRQVAATGNLLFYNNTSGEVSYDVVGNLTVTNATHATTANTANAVAGANVSGTVANANYAAYAGNVTIAAQANITSLGILTDLDLSNAKIHLGPNTGNVQGNSAIAIGSNAGNNQGDFSVAIGYYSGNTQGANSIALGYSAGRLSNAYSIAIGNETGIRQGIGAVTIGNGGGTDQGNYSTSIGYAAGASAHQYAVSVGSTAGSGAGNYAIAIGSVAGTNAGNNAIAIGANAGASAGNNAIAIGANAGATGNNSIILNATGAVLDRATANTFTVKPVRNANTANLMFYNATTGEVTYDVAGNITSVEHANTANIANAIAGSNVSGAVAYATTANSVAGANVSGTVANANYAAYAGNVTIAGQSNITSLGILTDLQLINGQIHLGAGANYSAQGVNSIAIGYAAGLATQGGSAVSIGNSAGFANQGGYAVAIGSQAGATNSGIHSISIGTLSGNQQQGNYSIAIGYGAGLTYQAKNSIILNASGASLNSTQADSLFIKPIRDVTGNVDFTKTLKYNPTTGEIGFV